MIQSELKDDGQPIQSTSKKPVPEEIVSLNGTQKEVNVQIK